MTYGVVKLRQLHEDPEVYASMVSRGLHEYSELMSVTFEYAVSVVSDIMSQRFL